jgi:hypothetical protein
VGALLLMLAACQSGSGPVVSDAKGHELGDTGVKVSGSVEAGGSALAR